MEWITDFLKNLVASDIVGAQEYLDSGVRVTRHCAILVKSATINIELCVRQNIEVANESGVYEATYEVFSWALF